MKLLKLNKEERKAVKDKIPDCFKKTELHVLLDNGEHSAPSVRALKIFDITQVTTTKTLQLRHSVLGSG